VTVAIPLCGEGTDMFISESTRGVADRDLFFGEWKELRHQVV
jgi:hypothetical protein